jgi:hypothetical protein
MNADADSHAIDDDDDDNNDGHNCDHDGHYNGDDEANDVVIMISMMTMLMTIMPDSNASIHDDEPIGITSISRTSGSLLIHLTSVLQIYSEIWCT